MTITEQFWLISYNTLNESFTISEVPELPKREDAIGWFSVKCYDEFDQPYIEKRTYVIDNNINSAFARGTLRIIHG